MQLKSKSWQCKNFRKEKQMTSLESPHANCSACMLLPSPGRKSRETIQPEMLHANGWYPPHLWCLPSPSYPVLCFHFSTPDLVVVVVGKEAGRKFWFACLPCVGRFFTGRTRLKNFVKHILLRKIMWKNNWKLDKFKAIFQSWFFFNIILFIVYE